MRELRDTTTVRRVIEARRVIGLERHYRCDRCDGEHRSWSRLRSCPDCGEALPFAVIHRAAAVPA